MRHSEKGFAIIEVAAAIAIIAVIGSAAAATTFQVIQGSELGNNRMTAVRQVQNAGYWISRDVQMAESVVTEDLSFSDFIILTWTERDYSGGDSTYHSVTYFLEDLPDGVGKLKRTHWSSAGANEQALIANYIYYDPADPDNTSKASYQNPVLTVQLAALVGEATETREYQIRRRPNL